MAKISHNAILVQKRWQNAAMMESNFHFGHHHATPALYPFIYVRGINLCAPNIM
jgi:hypothetical protein